ncbi:MAG: shikimate dehydrogenase [Dehalococcoidia bacterium]|nr:shikimate dehydrogenase [Dehalococcoidia bacterium]
MTTLTVGIIGYPLGHSISPAFQQAAFDHYGMDARYLVWETPADGLAQRIQSLRGPNVLGANVTVPHKEAVRSRLDTLSEATQRTGAVNTIVNRNGLLEGHNTDVPGFLRALKEDGGFDPKGKRVLLLGAGGAARAVAYALSGAGVASLTIANRTVERAQRLIQVLNIGAIAKAVPMNRDALATEKGWDLIVNTTTLGMWHSPGEGESPLPAGLILSHALVYDLVYNPPETPLLREARRAGARTLGGLPMLVYQGAAAFQLWTGKEAPLSVMFEAAQKALGQMGSSGH